MTGSSDKRLPTCDRRLAEPSAPAKSVASQLPFGEEAAVKNLLEVVASIIADEYIEVAMSNPEVFGEPGSMGGRKR